MVSYHIILPYHILSKFILSYHREIILSYHIAKVEHMFYSTIGKNPHFYMGNSFPLVSSFMLVTCIVAFSWVTLALI